MFGAWPWPGMQQASSATSPGGGRAPDRSRSPVGSSPWSAHSAATTGGSLSDVGRAPTMPSGSELPPSAPVWSTGVPQCDEWLTQNVLDAQLLNQFGEIPLRNRKNIVMKAITTPKQNPQAWIAGCVHNHRTREMERRLLAMPSPQTGGGHGATPNGERLPGGGGYTVAPPASVGTPQGSGGISSTQTGPEAEDPAMTTWAEQVWAEHSGNKSGMIRAVLATFSSSTTSEFVQLPPMLQSSLATAWILARPCNGDAGEAVVQGWLRRYKRLQAIPAPVASGASPTIVDPSRIVSLQFIVVGCIAGFQHTLIEGLCKLATLQRPKRFNMLPVLCTAADVSTAPMLLAMQKREGALEMEQAQDPTALATAVASKVSAWKQCEVKVVVVTTLPMMVAASANTTDAQAILHTPGARHFWFAQGLVSRMMAVLGNQNVLDIVITPYDLGNPGTRDSIAKLVGAVVPYTTPLSSARVAEEALVFSNCKVSEQAASTPTMRLPSTVGPIDGWECPGASVPELLSGPIAGFRTLPALLTTRLFQERALTPEEETRIANTMMTHTPTAQTRSASRQFHNRWMGVEGLPFSTALDSCYPCHNWILAVVGEPPSDKVCGESCGQRRYCTQCEAVFTLCGDLPALHILYPRLTALLDAALRQWSGQELDAWIARDIGPEVHACDASCPRNPCAGR